MATKVHPETYVILHHSLKPIYISKQINGFNLTLNLSLPLNQSQPPWFKTLRRYITPQDKVLLLFLSPVCLCVCVRERARKPKRSACIHLHLPWVWMIAATCAKITTSERRRMGGCGGRWGGETGLPSCGFIYWDNDKTHPHTSRGAACVCVCHSLQRFSH